MNFNAHSNLDGTHAFLSASGYHWLNYSDEKMAQTYANHLSTLRGTELHEFAATCIRLKQKLRSSNKTINRYVNDAIGYDMTPEVLLYYSNNIYGTTDAINFDTKKGFLRIHDLKTGITPAHMEQLYIYAALFCLEYDVKPGEIEMCTRLYQFDDYIEENPTADIILPIIDKIIRFDKILNDVREDFK